MGTVTTMSRDELLARRDDVLGHLGATLDELVARGRAGEFRDEEWAAWTEVCELQYLLGEEISAAPRSSDHR